MTDYFSRQRLKTWSLAFAFWTLVATSYAVSAVISSASEGHPASWLRTMSWYLLYFYLWMALTPLISWLGWLGAHGWRRFWVLHVPCSLLVAAAQSATMLSLYWWWLGPNPHSEITTFAGFLKDEVVFQFHLSALIYWLLLVVLRGMVSQRSLKDERLRNSQLEAQLAQSQLQTLRMQLQPHFLFNTLNAISALALADPAQARLMIARLSDFLRLTLEERHAQQVPLSREMQFLECYLGIQQVRFQDRLVTHLDVAGDTVNASVPSLILQPLVENAVRHGLAPRPGGGTVWVRASIEGATLCLSVEDDGVGLGDTWTDDRAGLGLSVTRERIAMLHPGQKASLHIGAREGGGTHVRVLIPANTVEVPGDE